jgi:hypothetical protein
MYKRGRVDEVISLILLYTVPDVEQTRIWRPVTMIPVGSGSVDSDDLASVSIQLVFEALGSRGYGTQQMRSSSSEILSKKIG